MPPPSHRRYRCRTLRAYETTHDCGMETIYYECTCGSKVFFDTGDPYWEKHDCYEYEPVILKDLPPLKVTCPRCGARVEPDQLSRHKKRIEFDPYKHPHSRTKCPKCPARVKNKDFVKHYVNVHGYSWCIPE